MFSGCCCTKTQPASNKVQNNEEVGLSFAQDRLQPKLAYVAHPCFSGLSEESSTRVDSELEEASRFQALVDSFAEKAEKGCPCTCIREGSGGSFETEYRIRQNDGLLLVMASPEAEEAEVSCPLDTIQDIYTMHDGPDCFPKEILHQAGVTGGLDLLLMVVCSSSSGDSSDGSVGSRFFLVESSRESLSYLLELLRVICS